MDTKPTITSAQDIGPIAQTSSAVGVGVIVNIKDEPSASNGVAIPSTSGTASKKVKTKIKTERKADQKPRKTKKPKIEKTGKTKASADDTANNGPTEAKRRKSNDSGSDSIPTTTAAAASSVSSATPPPHIKEEQSVAYASTSASASTQPQQQPATASTSTSSSASQGRKKNSLRNQLANQIISSCTKPMKKPQFVIRPANLSTMANSVGAGSSAAGIAPSAPNPNQNYALDPTCLLAVFRHLPPEALVNCSMVCKMWSTMSVDPQLWRRMNCAHHKLSASLLTAIVRRQPEHLILDWTTLAKRQLAWVIGRTPGLKHLSLQGTPLSGVLGLHTCQCPPLQILDLSFVRGLNDSAVRDVLSPPKDSRPGLADSKSRLRNLKQLKLAGTDISDVALRYVTQGVPSLVHLDLSSCQRITDAGVAQIGTCSSAINTLVELDLSSCKLVTESCLEYLSKCEALTYLDLRHVPQVSTQAVIKFAAKSKHDLQVRDIKLVDRRRVPLVAEGGGVMVAP